MFDYRPERPALQDVNGNYWVNAYSGILCLTGPESSSLYTLQEGLPSNQVHDIIQTSNGDIWVATEKGPAKKEGDKFVDVLKTHTLNPIQARIIKWDHQNRLWIGTPKGLYMWDGENLMAFNSQSGLMADDIQCLELDEQKYLWIGTSGGISRLNLNQKFELNEAPGLRWNGSWLNDQKIKMNQLATLPADSRLRFDYSAISLNSPSKDIQFQYKLEAVAPWESTESRTITLNNLEANQYELFVRTRSSNSKWSDPLRIPFELQKPIWQRIWVIILAMLLLFSGILATVINFQKGKRHRKEEAERIARELAQFKLKALQAQINPHFLFNAINVIQGYILQNDIDNSGLYLARFSRLMRMFLESSKKDFLPLSEEVAQLQLYVEMEQLCYAGRFELKLKVDDAIYPEEIEIPTMIFQPFVENAIHHGLLNKNGNGYLYIRFWMEEDYLRCSIKDDGVGREKAKAIKAEKSETVPISWIGNSNGKTLSPKLFRRKTDSGKNRDIKDINGNAAGTEVLYWIPITRD